MNLLIFSPELKIGKVMVCSRLVPSAFYYAFSRRFSKTCYSRVSTNIYGVSNPAQVSHFEDRVCNISSKGCESEGVGNGKIILCLVTVIW